MDREARIQAALLGLENGQFKSLRAAAEANDVSRSTLSYRRKGGHANHEAHPDQQVALLRKNRL
jgi:helix-turn-helix, Psq domain